MSLADKVAIVTGGNSRIGQAIVLELARLQANIVIDYVAHPEAMPPARTGASTSSAAISKPPDQRSESEMAGLKHLSRIS